MKITKSLIGILLIDVIFVAICIVFRDRLHMFTMITGGIALVIETIISVSLKDDTKTLESKFGKIVLCCAVVLGMICIVSAIFMN